MAVVKKEKTKRAVLLVAALMLLGALVLSLTTKDELAPVTDMLTNYGYRVYSDDIYYEDYPNTTIAALLDHAELDAAVAASKQAGFPSDVDRLGDVVLLLAATEKKEIITIYMIDGEAELCFVQMENSNEVKALGE